MLYDRSEKVRLRALESLCEIRAVPDLARALALASDASEHIRACACKLLGYAGMHAVVPLIDALLDGDVRVRRAAARALGCCVHDRMAQLDIKRIAANLDDADEEFCGAVAAVLKKTGRSCVPTLLGMALTTDQPTRVRILELLVELGDRACIDVFRVLVRDADPQTREAAAKGLLKMPDVRAVEPLVEVFSKDISKMGAFVNMLGHLPGKGIAELEKCLSSIYPSSRAFAVACLAELGAKDSSRKIAQRLHDESAEVRLEALRALNALCVHPSDEAEVVMRIADDDWRVRACALDCVSKHGIQAAYDAVVGCLADDRLDVRAAALAALGGLGIRRALPRICEMMLDQKEDYRTVEHAARMLAHEKDERLIAPFVEMLARGHFQELCMHALKKFGKKARAPLRNAMPRINEGRAGAIVLLYRLGDRGAMDSLLGLLATDKRSVLHAVLRSRLKKPIAEVLGRLSVEDVAELSKELDDDSFSCMLSNAKGDQLSVALGQLKLRPPEEALRVLLASRRIGRTSEESEQRIWKEIDFHSSKLATAFPHHVRIKLSNVRDMRARARQALKFHRERVD